MALGVETAGTVTAVGPEVTVFGVGDDVLTHCVPLREQGTWAEQVIRAAADCATKPAGVEWADAAVFSVPALTAAQVLDDALAVQPGETLLVHGAGGVTGRLIAQLAVVRGGRGDRDRGSGQCRPCPRSRCRGDGAGYPLEQASEALALARSGGHERRRCCIPCPCDGRSAGTQLADAISRVGPDLS